MGTLLKASPASSGSFFLKPPNFSPSTLRCYALPSRPNSRTIKPTFPQKKSVAFSLHGGNVEVQTETQAEDSVKVYESEPELEVQENVDSADSVAEELDSVVLSSLNSYKQAIQNNDETKSSEIESFLKSMEDEKTLLERKVAALSHELSLERDRILRISADFHYFRKRTENERLSLMKNAQGEVFEQLLSVLDSFERAKNQIKVETEGEEKIFNSYQSIYKQFIEILASLGVTTVGKPFDPIASFNRVIDQLIQRLYKVSSYFPKRWLHF